MASSKPSITIYVTDETRRELKRLRARLKRDNKSLSSWFAQRVKEAQEVTAVQK